MTLCLIIWNKYHLTCLQHTLKFRKTKEFFLVKWDSLVFPDCKTTPKYVPGHLTSFSFINKCVQISFRIFIMVNIDVDNHYKSHSIFGKHFYNLLTADLILHLKKNTCYINSFADSKNCPWSLSCRYFGHFLQLWVISLSKKIIHIMLRSTHMT